MSRPRLLDVFCGAGGAAMGYHRAGFDVVGVDLYPQPRYPFEFIQGDAFWALNNWGDAVPVSEGFDAIHASPPCQVFVSLSRMRGVRDHVNLIPQTRQLLERSGLPWVIENVPTARRAMRLPVQICGGGLGLAVQRHRLFEASFPLMGSPCAHVWPAGRPVAVYGSTGGWSHRNHNRGWSHAERSAAMQIDWMTNAELTQAIPPAYTEHIGGELLRQLSPALAPSGGKR